MSGNWNLSKNVNGRVSGMFWMKFNKKIESTMMRRKEYLKSRKQRVHFFVKERDDKFIDSCQGEFIQIDTPSKYVEYCDRFNVHNNSENIKRINRGSIMCAYVDRGDWIAYGWLSFQKPHWFSELDSVVYTSNSNTAVLYDFATNQDYRGQGWYGKLLNKMILQFPQAKYFIGYAKTENNASLRGMEKGGFVHKGTFCHSDGSLNEFYKEVGFTNKGSRYSLFGLKYNRKMEDGIK